MPRLAVSGSGYIFSSLEAHHDRTAFDCGVPVLSDFLKTKARKERDLGYSAVRIMVDPRHPTVIAGYYTLSAHSIELTDLSEALRKKLPRYPLVPTILLGRLACALAVQKAGAGERMLMDALSTAEKTSGRVGPHAVVVDAIDDRAAAFYRKYGFVPIVGQDRRLFLQMATIRTLGLDEGG